MSQITEDYVSFETSKLLKKKGFDAECDYFYADGILVEARGGKRNWNSGDTILADYDNECSAPTMQLVMKWLREVYHIAVSVYVFNRDLPIKENKILYTCDIATTKISSKEGHLRLVGTYKEVCEAAIGYCLENMI